MIYIIRKDWVIDWLSIKLDNQNANLYKILKIKDYLYIINLSSYMKINNMFYIDYLQKASDNSLSS